MAYQKRLPIQEIQNRKRHDDPIICLTAYTYPIAKILDQHVDIILVGDTLGMVLYGMDSTLAVTVEMMIEHGKAVMRGSENACVIIDMPFGSYQQSKEQAFESAARIMQHTSCSAIKLEGGVEMAETVSFLTERGIPVMGHVGLMPQHVNVIGGFKFQGRDDITSKKIIEDAIAIEKAGAFSIVVEGVVENLATEITKKISIPTIGIGASASCDGQILVTEDMLGLFPDFTPKFVKKYSNLSEYISDAVIKYREEVKSKKFPKDEHCYY